MSWTVVQSVFNKSTFALPSATFAAPMTAGNLLVVFYYGAITGSSVLNTTAYALVSQNGPGGSTATQYGQTRTIQSGDGSSILAPSNDSTQICYVMAIELHHSSGLQAFDAEAHQISSAPVVGPTTAVSDELALMSSALGGGFGIYTPASGWANDQTDGGGSTTLDHLAVSTGGTPTTGTPAWTAGGTNAHWMVLAFKPGVNTETGVGRMTFGGVAMAGAGIAKHLGSAVMTFGGIKFVASGRRARSGVGKMTFGGIKFVASGRRAHTGMGLLAFRGIAMLGHGADIPQPDSGLAKFGIQNKDLQPLTWNVPMVDPHTGFPAPEFQRKWQKQFSILEAQQKLNGTVPTKAYVDAQDLAVLAAATSYADTKLPLTGGTLSGPLGLPSGSASAPALAFSVNWGLYYDPNNNLQTLSTAMILAQGGLPDYVFAQSATGSANFYVTSNANSANNTVWGFGAGVNTNLGQYNLRRSHGGYAAPTFPVLNDFIGDIRWSVSDRTTIVNSIALRGIVIDTAPSATAGGGRLVCLTTPIGSTVLTETYRVEFSLGLSMYGANVVVSANRGLVFRSTTVAAAQAFAGLVAGETYVATDVGGGNGLIIYDGTIFRRLQETGTRSRATDADFALVPLADAPNQWITASATSGRAVTLGTTNASDGSLFEITYSAASGSNYTVAYGSGGGASKTIAPSTWAKFVYDATATFWRLAAAGAL